MKITISTIDSSYAGYIVKAGMRIRGRSISFEKVREMILTETINPMAKPIVKDMEQ